MRRMLAVLTALAAVSAFAKEGHAQQVGFSDPFFLYYGYFLPRQAAIANQPHVEDTINSAVASQQAYAQTNRAGLYDPAGGYGSSDPFSSTDPLDSPNRRGTGGRAPMGVRSRGSIPTTNINGSGPALYFNRTAQHYPNMTRMQHGPNRNLAVAGRGVRSGAGAPRPNAMSGMNPGPR
jgi:hypothetical protein